MYFALDQRIKLHAEIAWVDIAGVDNDGGKAQEMDNDGVDFTELSWAAALPSCSRTERLKLTWKTHIFCNAVMHIFL